MEIYTTSEVTAIIEWLSDQWDCKLTPDQAKWYLNRYHAEKGAKKPGCVDDVVNGAHLREHAYERH